VRYDAEHPGYAWFDDDWARLSKGVDNALPDHMNVLANEGTHVLVFSYSDTDPGAYYTLDLGSRKLEPLVATRRGIDPARMPHREALRYAARDGLSIPAFLTLPRDRPARALPLVVDVHGGPWVRGSGWGWNGEAAYLASLGYAVLQPEYRGSTGWGRKAFEASWKQWGRAMQDDLDDGVDALVKRGVADPARVCIMGASYGGYAVMMGLARNPERWKCGVDMVGVTDIDLMFDVTWSDSWNSEFMRYDAREMIGDQDKAADAIEQGQRVATTAPQTIRGRFAAQRATIEGDLPAAVEQWRVLAGLTPDDTDAERNLAVARGAGGDYAAAVASLRNLSQRDGNDPRVWYELGKYSILSGDAQHAVDDDLVRALVQFKRSRNLYGEAETVNALGIGYGAPRADRRCGGAIPQSRHAASCRRQPARRGDQPAQPRQCAVLDRAVRRSRRRPRTGTHAARATGRPCRPGGG
jgi:poly(3-hydroxybutyrate) depolymerase